VTVHGRTVKQRYIGPSNWDFLARVKRHIGSNIILGSGDLFTARAAKKMMEETGVDGVTVARGAIGNPFIFRECRALLNGSSLAPPSIPEQRKAIELHLTEMEKIHDTAWVGPLFRKFGISYSDLHPMASEVRRAFIEAKTTQGLHDVLNLWYDDRRDWPTVRPREKLGHLVAAGAEA
jgi:tRNA-dihydrouridine synthase